MKQKSHEEIRAMSIEEIDEVIKRIGEQLKIEMEKTVKKSQAVIRKEGMSKVLDIKFIKDEEKGFSFQIVNK